MLSILNRPASDRCRYPRSTMTHNPKTTPVARPRAANLNDYRGYKTVWCCARVRRGQ